MRILLVEDDQMIGKSLVLALRHSGLAVDWVRDGNEAIDVLAAKDHGLVLLDLGLPGVGGLEVLASLRKKKDDRHVLIITARDDIESRVKGLDAGADDYIAKPFDYDELAARIRAASRRQTRPSGSKISTGELELDAANHEVTYRGKSQILPAKEFALLSEFAGSAGVILSRPQLENRLYGWGDEVESNAVEVLIHYIRRRFDKDIIRNVRGAGWMVPKGKP